jgi:hypothetical protein
MELAIHYLNSCQTQWPRDLRLWRYRSNNVIAGLNPTLDVDVVQFFLRYSVCAEALRWSNFANKMFYRSYESKTKILLSYLKSYVGSTKKYGGYKQNEP